MNQANIPHLEKPVSRLVIGVDNQTELEPASAVFDDFIARGGNCFDTAFIYGVANANPFLGSG